MAYNITRIGGLGDFLIRSNEASLGWFGNGLPIVLFFIILISLLKSDVGLPRSLAGAGLAGFIIGSTLFTISGFVSSFVIFIMLGLALLGLLMMLFD